MQRALISVSNKAGVVEFAAGLVELGWTIISTGGTATALRDGKVGVMPIQAFTGVPEIMGGRVKTIHPKIAGGILARRHVPSDMNELQNTLRGAEINLVAVNLYPFQQTAAKEGVEFDELIEQIDIGGPSLVRAAAKNFRDVIVIVDPADYAEVLQRLRDQRADDLQFRADLARKAFGHTAEYDQAIVTELVGWVTMDGVSFVKTAEIC